MSNDAVDFQTNQKDFQDLKTSANKKQVKKKLGFLSVIALVVGSSIGAGIFFKSGEVLQNTHFSLGLSIIAWVIAGIGVIAMGLALMEIVSARNDNLSIVGWCQTFTKRFFYKSCKNFMFWVNAPLTYFVMPMYGILSFQVALYGFGVKNPNFGTADDWIIWMVIALAIGLWFMIFSGLSPKMGSIQNWMITSVKFIPLVGIAIIGFVYAGQAINEPEVFNKLGTDINIQNHINTVWPKNGWSNLQGDAFFIISPVIGLFGSLASIFFAFDGFYVVAGIQSEMKKPKKASLAIVIGLSTITILSIIIAISMSIVGNGTLTGLELFFRQKPHLMILFGFLNLFIAIGTLGIINGFSMWIPRFVEDLILQKEIPFSQKLAPKIRPDKPLIGLIYQLCLTIPLVILFCTIGGLAYIPTIDYWYPGSYFDGGPINPHTHLTLYNSMAKLYSFCNLIANWTGLMVFSFIVTAIIGGLVNRKTKKIKTVQSKFFYPMGIIASIIVLLGLVFQVLEPFINLFLLGRLIAHGSPILEQEIIGRIMLVVVFIFYIAMMIIPEWFTRSNLRRNKIRFQLFKLKVFVYLNYDKNQKNVFYQVFKYYLHAKIDFENEVVYYSHLTIKAKEDLYQLDKLALANERVNSMQKMIVSLEKEDYEHVSRTDLMHFLNTLKDY